MYQVNQEAVQSMFDKCEQSWEILESLGGVSELYTVLQTDPKNGISNAEGRAEQFGSNKLRPPSLSPFYMCMYKQSKDFCIRILALATVIMFLMAFFSEEPFEQVVQAISILVAISAVVIIGALTDYRKEKQFIQLFLEQEEQQRKIFQVVRGGQTLYVDHWELLVGDVITIKPGDNVTVDGILIEGSEQVDVDESMITGLTDALLKQPITKGHNCFTRGGSNIFEGTAKMLVLAVGEKTYSNRMKNNSNEEEEELIHDEQSPLSKALESLAKFLVFIGCMSALCMFIVLELYMVRELRELQQKLFSQLALAKVLTDFINAFLIIVLSIPEGLPLIVTLSLAFSIAKLKQQDVVIRNLHVCQVLGGIDTICFDKTGTLTYNNLKVSNVHIANQDRTTTLRTRDSQFRILSEAVLSTNSAFLQEQDSQQSQEKTRVKTPWSGNRLDVALMEFVEDKFNNRGFVLEYQSDLKAQSRKTIPLNYHGFHVEVLQVRGDKYRIIVKGKSKEVIEKCSTFTITGDKNIYEPGKFVFQECDIWEMSNEQIEIESRAVLTYNSQSLKTISFAYKDIQIPNLQECDWNEIVYQKNDFTLIATMAMRDDIRVEARRLNNQLRQGSMDVVIVTGDTRVNAVNVAKQLSWVSDDNAELEIQRVSEHIMTEDVQLLIESTPVIEQQKSLILNFQEYVLRIRKILSESKIFYTHQEVNPQNILSKLPEIIEDDIARKKVFKMNKSMQILADLDQQQKHQYLEVYSKINDATIGYVGDGNNDAIALRNAAVGFTLGKTATNVARECSGVILMNDNLEGIELCMKWGRNIFLNIKRFIYFQLSFFLNSIAIMLTASIFFKQQPYSVLQVIWLSLVQDIFSAIALSTEIPQDDVLKRTKPARKGENLIDKFLLQITCTQAVFQYLATVCLLFMAPMLFSIEPSYNHDLHALGAEFVSEWAVHFTMVYHLTAMFQIINLICSRRVGRNEYNAFEGIQKNRPFTIMIISLLIIEQVIIYAGDKYFKTAPLTLSQNLFCVVFSFGAMGVFWLSKYMF